MWTPTLAAVAASLPPEGAQFALGSGPSRSCRSLRHEDGTKIVHVGHRRTRHHRIAKRFEETVAVVVGETLPGIDAEPPRAIQRIRRGVRAGNLLHAVHAVGIARERMHAA